MLTLTTTLSNCWQHCIVCYLVSTSSSRTRTATMAPSISLPISIWYCTPLYEFTNISSFYCSMINDRVNTFYKRTLQGVWIHMLYCIESTVCWIQVEYMCFNHEYCGIYLKQHVTSVPVRLRDHWNDMYRKTTVLYDDMYAWCRMKSSGK